MPAAIPIILGAVAGGASAAIAGTALLTGALIGGALAAASALLAPKPQSINADALRPDTRSTIVADVEGARWALGRARTGGSLKFYQETRTTAIRCMACARAIGRRLRHHRKDIHQRGRTCRSRASANRLALGGAYAGKAWLFEYFAGDGTQGDEIRAACSNFTDDHQVRGAKSWIAVQLRQPFSTGMPTVGSGRLARGSKW